MARIVRIVQVMALAWIGSIVLITLAVFLIFDGRTLIHLHAETMQKLREENPAAARRLTLALPVGLPPSARDISMCSYQALQGKAIYVVFSGETAELLKLPSQCAERMGGQVEPLPRRCADETFNPDSRAVHPDFTPWHELRKKANMEYSFFRTATFAVDRDAGKMYLTMGGA